MIFHGVKVYNPKQPWMYAGGGKVHTRSDMSLKQRLNDSVKAIVQPGELIIPVVHKGLPNGALVHNVIGYLRRHGVRLPNT